jgi:hypothetical protein
LIDADSILKKYQVKQTSNQISTLIDTDNNLNINSETHIQNILPENQSMEEKYNKIFVDAKKKLRTVLSWSNADYQLNIKLLTSKDNYLVKYLKIQLSEAILVNDNEKEAYLNETIRCLNSLNQHQCHKLLDNIKLDYKKRAHYISYLAKSKQNLLNGIFYIEKLIFKLETQHKSLGNYLISLVIRNILESKENEINEFIQKFISLIAVDEKNHLFQNKLNNLTKEMKKIWPNQDDHDYVHETIKRQLMSHVYLYALFPNGEIEHLSDKKLSDCLSTLSESVHPGDELIGIPSIYHFEQPWTLAQIELKRINSFKTPNDKLNCIKKCINATLNLLSIAKSPVCADDLQPVLIYIIIKANPKNLSSTIQFIQSFFCTQQLLEQEFEWVQFIVAFSYIKAKLFN